MQYPFAFPSELDGLFSSFNTQSLVIGQVGQSLDGRVATLNGQSKYINGEAGLLHLHRLRSLADAVVVGVGTVIADDPLLNVRFCSGQSPARVIIDPRGRLSLDALVLRDDGVRSIVVTTAASRLEFASHVERIDIQAVNDRIEPDDIIECLHGMDLFKILVEGGPLTLARFINAQALDRLHIITSPIILGSGKTGFNLLPIHSLDEALRPKTKAYMVGNEVIFDCEFGG